MTRAPQAVTKGTITKVKVTIRTATIHRVRTVATSLVSISIILIQDTDGITGTYNNEDQGGKQDNCGLLKTRIRETNYGPSRR